MTKFIFLMHKKNLKSSKNAHFIAILKRKTINYSLWMICTIEKYSYTKIKNLQKQSAQKSKLFVELLSLIIQLQL